MRGSKLRVLVVDDSAFMRRIISDLLAEDPGLEIAGRARNGLEAVRMVSELQPDVVTLDIEMPVKNGLEALREIMRICPTPVVMVSSLTQEGANETMQALDAGAVDFVTKPSGTISLDMGKIGAELRQKVLEAGRIPAGHLRVRSRPAAPPRVQTGRTGARKKVDMIVVAASTGGPMALQDLLPVFKKAFPVPILIVQHMPPGFTASFAARLNERSRIEVAEAVDGMPIRRGNAVVAPGGLHLAVERRGAELVCKLLDTPPVRSVKPSADVLFTSAAEVLGGNVLAVVLTGMGKDGLDGIRALHTKGAYVIVESKETCVVNGMPGSVEAAGLANAVLPLYEIGSEVENILGL